MNIDPQLIGTWEYSKPSHYEIFTINPDFTFRSNDPAIIKQYDNILKIEFINNTCYENIELQYTNGKLNPRLFGKSWDNEIISFIKIEDSSDLKKKKYLDTPTGKKQKELDALNNRVKEKELNIFIENFKNENNVTDLYEIGLIGFGDHCEILERSLESFVKTNKHRFRINLGLNVPTPRMLSMVDKYKKDIHAIHISDIGLRKMGMQDFLVKHTTAKYLIQFDDDTYAINHDWQDHFIHRINQIEKERKIQNKVSGLMGLVFFHWFEELGPEITLYPWYDKTYTLKRKVEEYNKDAKKHIIFFVAGAWQVILREAFIKIKPNEGMQISSFLSSDAVLSYCFMHHGFELDTLAIGCFDADVDIPGKYLALGNRLIVNDGPPRHNHKKDADDFNQLNAENKSDIITAGAILFF